jgi:AMMECR1 domain-containing protein
MKGPPTRQRLRGCIGTLQPRHIKQGIKDYALISALRDHRFDPVQWKELSSLECTVSLLTHYEDVDHYLDWQASRPHLRRPPGTYSAG